MKKKNNQNFTAYEDKIKYFCSQNQIYSKMLYEIIEKNRKEANKKSKSYSDLFKLLTRFNQALSSQADMIESENLQKREGMEKINKFGKQLMNNNFGQNQQENILNQLSSQIIKMKEEESEIKYQKQIQKKNEEMKKMIKQKQQNIGRLKNKIQKISQQRIKQQNKLNGLRKSIISDQIKLRQFEIQQNKIHKK